MFKYQLSLEEKKYLRLHLKNKDYELSNLK